MSHVKVIDRTPTGFSDIMVWPPVSLRPSENPALWLLLLKIFSTVSLFVCFFLVIKADLLFLQIEQFSIRECWFNYIKHFLECTDKQTFFTQVFWNTSFWQGQRTLSQWLFWSVILWTFITSNKKPYYPVANNRKFRTSRKEMLHF